MNVHPNDAKVVNALALELCDLCEGTSFTVMSQDSDTGWGIEFLIFIHQGLETIAGSSILCIEL